MALSEKKRVWPWVVAVLLLLFAAYKGLQILAGLTVGGSFGAGIGPGSMSGKQQVETYRTVETDAPAQVIYRIDDHRFLTLENYIRCDRGGQVYYHDSQKGIKTHLGDPSETKEWNYAQGNDLLAYRGIIINAADNGELAFGLARDRPYCGSGNATRGCPVSFIYSSDEGRHFRRIVLRDMMPGGGNYTDRYTFMMLNNEYYIFNNEADGDLEPKADHVKIENGKFTYASQEREREFLKLSKNEMKKRNIPFGNDTGPEYDPYQYIYNKEFTNGKTFDELTEAEVNYSNIATYVRSKMKKSNITPPLIKKQIFDKKYHCDASIKAKSITYIDEFNHRETVNNEQ